MKFSNFLFSESRDPEQDGRAIDETLCEAVLSEQLGMDAVWLAEHHFDGNCAYVDPVTFAAALAVATKRVRIGFAVAQTSLHHPIRLAEQLALIDHLSHGRLIVGLGRGTAYNIYEYQGYGIDPEEAHDRFEEAAEVMLKAWSGGGFTHQGKFWNLNVPVLRPRPYTRPHPAVIRSASSERSMVEIARRGQPFLMNVQTNATVRQRLDLYCRTMRDSGRSDAQVAAALRDCWVWKNVHVAETDAEAERVGIPAFVAMQEHRAAMRNRVRAEQGAGMDVSHAGPGVRADPKLGLICGSPATVAQSLSEVAATGVGGVILSCRLGPMPYETAAASLTLLMREVAPGFRVSAAA